MEIPIAVPCHGGIDYKSAEEYTLGTILNLQPLTEPKNKKFIEYYIFLNTRNQNIMCKM